MQATVAAAAAMVGLARPDFEVLVNPWSNAVWLYGDVLVDPQTQLRCSIIDATYFTVHAAAYSQTVIV